MTKAVFIFAAAHSGSTLLDLVLGSHSCAVSLGEITHLPKNLALDTECTCGEKVSACPIWEEVVARLEQLPAFAGARSNPYVLNLGYIMASSVVDPAHQTTLYGLKRRLIYGLSYYYLRYGIWPLRPAFGPVMTGAANKLVLFDTVASVTNKQVLVDSSKHYLEAVSLYRAAPDRVRIIILTRDGRAVFYSGIKRGMPQRAALEAWRKTYARGIPVIKRHVSEAHRLQVSYEDLARNPSSEVSRICDFIEIPFEPGMLDFGSRTHHVTNGNRMRFSETAKIRYDNSWEQGLVAKDYFEAHGGAQNRALGYR